MADNNRYKKFYVEWWHIRKSTIYGLIALGVFAVLIVGGTTWASRNNWFQKTDDVDIPQDAARIISFEGDVRIIRAQTRETILVTKQTYVAAGDTIQTQADGRAIVRMIDGSVYSVRPNSTVVVRDSTSLFGGKNVRVRVNDGQLNVRTDEEPEDTKNIVELGESENQVGPKTDASFNANGPDGGEIRISRGGVETTMGGETTQIGENQYATVNGDKLSPREKLLAPPRPQAPLDSAQIVNSSGNGVNVTFTWQDSEAGNALNYYIQVAKTPMFSSDSIMVDRNGLPSREFRMAGLSSGTYYWRLKSTSRSGQTTNWDDPWKFTVVNRAASTQIDATDWSVENLGGNVYMISGKTQPGMTVRAGDRSVYAGPDGSFTIQLSTQSTEAAVEISDERGNHNGFILSMRSGRLVRRY